MKVLHLFSLALVLAVVAAAPPNNPGMICSCDSLFNSSTGRVECNLRVTWSNLVVGSYYWIGIYLQSEPVFPPMCPRLFAPTPLTLHALSAQGNAAVPASVTGIVGTAQLKCFLWQGDSTSGTSPSCDHYYAYSAFSFSGSYYGRQSPSNRRVPPPKPIDFRPTNPVPPKSTSRTQVPVAAILVPVIVGFALIFGLMIFCLIRLQKKKETATTNYAPVNEGVEMSDVSAPQVSYQPQPTYIQSNVPSNYVLGGQQQPQMVMMTNTGVPMPPQYVMSNNPYASVQMVYAMPQQGFAGNQPVYIATNPQGFYATQAVPQQMQSTPQPQQ